jgi:hypothetical protein
VPRCASSPLTYLYWHCVRPPQHFRRAGSTEATRGRRGVGSPAQRHSRDQHRRPANDVWPWLLQLGYRRAGWHPFDLFDRDGIRSAETILPEFQHLEVGQIIGEEGFTGTRVEQNRTSLLTFHNEGTQWV